MPFLLRRRRPPAATLTAADGEPVAKSFTPPGANPAGGVVLSSAAQARGGAMGGPVPADIAAAMEAQGFDPTQSFSPGRPIQPWFGYSADPRAWDMPTGWNLTSRPRASVSRASFDTLRVLTSGAYDVARICIEHRIDAMRSYEWRLTPLEGFESNIDEALDAARRALKRPDGRNRFGPWLAMLMENILRYDAPALYRRRNRAGGVIGLEVIDGPTIAPLLDYYGRRPAAPAPAFVQYANGLPWDWLTDRDLIYEPFRPQTDSPYGVAPIESIIVAANSDMRLAQYLLDTYTEGSIPGATAEAPAEYSSPDKIKDLQEAWDAWVQGDQTQKTRVRWVPSGTNMKRFLEGKFDEHLALWFTRKTCAAFCVLPQALGLTQDVNRANAEAQQDIGEQVGDVPLAQHIEGFVDSYLQDDLGLPVAFNFDLGRDKEDRLDEARVWQIGIDEGAAGVDEMREKFFGLPTDPERPVPRFIKNDRLGPIPLDSLFRVAGPVDSETQAPTEAQPLDLTPFKGVDGIMPVKLPGEANFHVLPLNPDEPERPQLEVPVPGSDIVATPPKQASLRRVRKDANKALVAAGLVVKASDTGRVLMLQRSMGDETDPAAGTWEFPGGHIDPGESAWSAACREWQEETGAVLPAGTFGGTWTVGIYQGFVWLVDAEFPVNAPAGGRVLNPDDPDGDDIEVCAWWDPAEAAYNPALRLECRGNDWSLIVSAAPVQKEMTAGVTSATGVTGVDLHGSHGSDDDVRAMAEALVDNDYGTSDPEKDAADVLEDFETAVRKDLRRWRDNARSRVKSGRPPRPFTSDVIPAELHTDITARLAGAATVEEVNAAFIPVAKAGPSPKADAGAHPAHRYLDALASHYAPKVSTALRSGVTGLRAAVEAAHAALPVAKAAQSNPGRAVALTAATEAIRANVSLDPAQLEAILRELVADGYLAGSHVAAQAIGGGATVVGSLSDLDASIDWSSWAPGHGDAAAAVADGGLADLLDGAGVAIDGITDTTLDRLGNALAASLLRGDSVEATSQALDSILDDPDRAWLIADTESARAMGQASLDTYGANGVPGKQWLTEPDACPICDDNESVGVIPADESFPSGDDAPPAHPRCRCSVAPAYDLPGSVESDDEES